MLVRLDAGTMKLVISDLEINRIIENVLEKN